MMDDALASSRTLLLFDRCQDGRSFSATEILHLFRSEEHLTRFSSCITGLFKTADGPWALSFCRPEPGNEPIRDSIMREIPSGEIHTTRGILAVKYPQPLATRIVVRGVFDETPKAIVHSILSELKFGKIKMLRKDAHHGTRIYNGHISVYVEDIVPQNVPNMVTIQGARCRLFLPNYLATKRCSKCLEEGHISNECQNEMRCWSCKASGHKKADCQSYAKTFPVLATSTQVTTLNNSGDNGSTSSMDTPEPFAQSTPAETVRAEGKRQRSSSSDTSTTSQSKKVTQNQDDTQDKNQDSGKDHNTQRKKGKVYENMGDMKFYDFERLPPGIQEQVELEEFNMIQKHNKKLLKILNDRDDNNVEIPEEVETEVTNELKKIQSLEPKWVAKLREKRRKLEEKSKNQKSTVSTPAATELELALKERKEKLDKKQND